MIRILKIVVFFPPRIVAVNVARKRDCYVHNFIDAERCDFASGAALARLPVSPS